jgi:hypothetical protein
MCEAGGIALAYLAALPGHLPCWISSSAPCKLTLKLLVPFNFCLLSLNSLFTPATIRRHPTIEQANEIGEAGISKKLHTAVVIISIVVTASNASFLTGPGCSARVGNLQADTLSHPGSSSVKEPECRYFRSGPCMYLSPIDHS